MNSSNDYLKPKKLKIHQFTVHGEDFLFNSSDFPSIKQDDFIKVFQDGNSLNYLLFQVKLLRDGVVPKDYVSIEQSLANKVGMKVFLDVLIVLVDPEDVTIDLLEVSFKDQYISRSDMWRMKKYLVNSCVYIDQSLEFTDVRAQVSELWVNSTKARCGFISESTNFVLRSYTAKVYVFIQMSSEMWEYDAYGYLQFERAIDGFLKALFTKWKDKKCCHELTLVLFSRTFYETRSMSDFPKAVQNAVRTDYEGRLYVDFYKCVVQSEKLEDCTPLLTKLKKLVHKYDELTQLPGCPKGTNSKSAQGNFLEAINMSLNVFERHNIDRNFDGTGQIVVCITPGVGVFDVDRDLTILTKERMIDNGIGSDLICLGQQPLHAVPLFKFHHKYPERQRTQKLKLSNKSSQLQQYDFNIPHWINHSFYTSNPFLDKGTTNIKFVPRINAPLKESSRLSRKMSSPVSPKQVSTDSESLPTIQQLSFAEYDKQIFRFHKPAFNFKPPVGDAPGLKHSIPDNHKKMLMKTTDFSRPLSPDTKRRRSRPVHIPLHKSHGLLQDGFASSLGAGAIRESQIKQQKEDEAEKRPVIGSATMSRKSTYNDDFSSPTSRRALFNPFNPLQMFAPLTANRRRWVHTYPRGPQGEALVLHHRKSSGTRLRRSSHRESESADEDATLCTYGASSSPLSIITGESPASVSFNVQHTLHGTSGSFDDASSTTKATSASSFVSARGATHCSLGDYIDSSSGDGDFVSYRGFRSDKPISSYGLSWMWGIAGDIQWTTDTYTGLDWKSLKCPACLPITTDYCPKQSHLQSGYTEHSYTLIPDDTAAERCDEDFKLKPDSLDREYSGAKEIFLELVNQRLCQGFQIIKQTKRMRSTDSTSSCVTLISPTVSDGSYRSLVHGTSPMYPMIMPVQGPEGDAIPNGFMLSHGRQYHVLRLSPDDDKIEVIIYKQRHPSNTPTIDYNYMLWPKTRGRFQTSQTCFAHKIAEDSYWNHLDDYICYPDGSTIQNLVYWQTKFVAVAAPTKRMSVFKAANENNKQRRRFDVFHGCGCKTSHDNSVENGECGALTDGFVRFLEHLNKFKRSISSNSRKPWRSFSACLSKSLQSTPMCSGTINSNHATPTPPRARSSTPNSERSTPVRFSLDVATSGPPPTLSENLLQKMDIQQPVPVKHNDVDTRACCASGDSRISIDSEFSDIIEAMKDSQGGLGFLAEREEIPKYTFVSLDAVHWSIENVDGIICVKEACDYLDRIRCYGFLCHLSGDRQVPFTYGYTLYSLYEDQQQFEMEDPSSNQYQDTRSSACYNGQKIQYFEVAFERKELEKSDLCPHHNLSSSFDAPQGKSGAFFVPSDYKFSIYEKATPPVSKLVKIVMPNRKRTLRSEFCQFRYSSAVRCGVDSFIFCFELQWLIATATCLFNMLQAWHREAGRCDLYFFPVPLRPFAFPSAGVAGPLYCPLFVPLNVKVLFQHSQSFNELLQSPEKYRPTLISIMESILSRFGFLRDQYHSQDIEPNPVSVDDSSLNFVHFTGQVLAQIPIRSRVVQRNSVNLQHHHIYCQRGLSAAPPPSITQNELDSVGFYWTFNHMLSKRWRHTVLDDCPPSELERDFVSFCANDDSRLIAFFDDFSNH